MSNEESNPPDNTALKDLAVEEILERLVEQQHETREVLDRLTDSIEGLITAIYGDECKVVPKEEPEWRWQYKRDYTLDMKPTNGWELFLVDPGNHYSNEYIYRRKVYKKEVDAYEYKTYPKDFDAPQGGWEVGWRGEGMVRWRRRITKTEWVPYEEYYG